MHTGSFETRYMHLDEIREDLKPGMKVKAGEMIGTVGNTGTSSKGAHLHLKFMIAACQTSLSTWILSLI